MAIEDGVSTDIDWPNRPAFKHYGSRLLRGLLLTVAAVNGVVFWGLIVRLHLQRGDIASAVVVSLLFVIPAILGYAYRLRLKLPGACAETTHWGQ